MRFNLTKIKLSKYDIKRGLTLPKYPSKELAEFVGILIGDGYLYERQYTIGIVGNHKTDKIYFNKIQNIILHLFNLKGKIRIRQRAIRLTLKSKGLFSFLTKVIDLEHGRYKGRNVKIPKIFIENNKFTKEVIRGIFDTDGTIFTSNKKGVKHYPTIELTTTSLQLANQVKEILRKEEFKVAGVRKYKYNHSWLISNKVSLYGKKNIFLWYKKICFSNNNKQEKLIKIIKKWGLWNLNPRQLRLQRTKPHFNACALLSRSF